MTKQKRKRWPRGENEATARELRSVARALYREAKQINSHNTALILEWHANGMKEAALICARRASKLTVKAKKKPKERK